MPKGKTKEVTGISEKDLAGKIDELISYLGEDIPQVEMVGAPVQQLREDAATALSGVDPDQKLFEVLDKTKNQLVGKPISQARDIIVGETLVGIGLANPSDDDKEFVIHFYGGRLTDPKWWETIYDIALDPSGTGPTLPSEQKTKIREQVKEEQLPGLPKSEPYSDIGNIKTYFEHGQPSSAGEPQ